MKSRVLLLVCGLLAVAGMAAACDSESGEDLSGQAAQAAARFFDQEAAAGTLPEGTTNVRPRGSQGVVELDRGDSDARYCVEFEYLRAEEPFDTHVRVYVASLSDDAWRVEAVSPDGTCEGVD